MAGGVARRRDYSRSTGIELLRKVGALRNFRGFL